MECCRKCCGQTLGDQPPASIRPYHCLREPIRHISKKFLVTQVSISNPLAHLMIFVMRTFALSHIVLGCSTPKMNAAQGGIPWTDACRTGRPFKLST